MTQCSQTVNKIFIWCIIFFNLKLIFSTQKMKRLKSKMFRCWQLFMRFFLSFFPLIYKMQICYNLQKNILTNRCSLVFILGSTADKVIKTKNNYSKPPRYFYIHNATSIKLFNLKVIISLLHMLCYRQTYYKIIRSNVFW